jgi:hypothetical protein
MNRVQSLRLKLKGSAIQYFLLAVAVFFTFSVQAQTYPFSLSCKGSGTAGPTNLTLHFANFITGEGVLDGTPIVTTNQMDGGDANYSLIGWPKTQDTGRVSDIFHKVVITVNRFNGQFTVIVSNAKSGAILGRSSGTCDLNAKPKF